MVEIAAERANETHPSGGTLPAQAEEGQCSPV